jgi:hypothetical protein
LGFPLFPRNRPPAIRRPRGSGNNPVRPFVAPTRTNSRSVGYSRSATERSAIAPSRLPLSSRRHPTPSAHGEDVVIPLAMRRSKNNSLPIEPRG